jgi:uncharacterized membrane protein HdeD (DUF308 family)
MHETDLDAKEAAMATNSGVTPPSPGTVAPSRGARVYSPTNLLAGDPVRQEAMSAVLAQNWWLMALRGVFAVLFGLIALFAPGAALLSLALLFSAYMLVDGALGIAAGVRAAQRNERWGWLIGEGLANIAAGVIAFIWPGLTVVAFVLLIAFWALISGGFMLAAAFRLKADHGRWWLALGGIASLIFGVLLVIAPLVGAVVFAWWLGAYAIVFGIMLLVLAFQLRNRNESGTGTGAGGTSGSAVSQGA